jgi:hypothetical protein
VQPLNGLRRAAKEFAFKRAPVIFRTSQYVLSGPAAWVSTRAVVSGANLKGMVNEQS